MLTPSLVFAYWMRGSIIRPPPPPLPPDSLQRLPPPVLERHARRRPRQRPHRVRHQHLTRRRQAADPRRNVHRATVDVVAPVRVFLPRHVAGVEAEVQGQTGVIAGLAAAARRLDRLPRPRDRREHAVAQRRALYRRPRALADQRPQGDAELPRLRPEGSVAQPPGGGGG